MIKASIISAPQVSKESWLSEPEYGSFIRGYEYAATQTRAIPGLSKVTPEETYFIYESVKRGISLSLMLNNLPRYTVQKAGNNDTLSGPVHYSQDSLLTLCGLFIDKDWMILSNDCGTAADCKKCKAANKNI